MDIFCIRNSLLMYSVVYGIRLYFHRSHRIINLCTIDRLNLILKNGELFAEQIIESVLPFTRDSSDENESNETYDILRRLINIIRKFIFFSFSTFSPCFLCVLSHMTTTIERCSSYFVSPRTFIFYSFTRSLRCTSMF